MVGTILVLPAGSLGVAQIGGEQSPTELVAEGGVTAQEAQPSWNERLTSQLSERRRLEEIVGVTPILRKSRELGLRSAGTELASRQMHDYRCSHRRQSSK